MPAPILVFGIGNESRGDDALGVLLLRRLRDELGSDPSVELIETYQLQLEHTLDLAGREWVLFADAGAATPEPYHFYRARPTVDHVPFSHALTPEALLAVHRQVVGEPPPAYVMCIRGESFELGEPMSEKAATRLDAALERTREFLVARAASPASLRQQPRIGDGGNSDRHMQARPPALQDAVPRT